MIRKVLLLASLFSFDLNAQIIQISEIEKIRQSKTLAEFNENKEVLSEKLKEADYASQFCKKAYFLSPEDLVLTKEALEHFDGNEPLPSCEPFITLSYEDYFFKMEGVFYSSRFDNKKNPIHKIGPEIDDEEQNLEFIVDTKKAPVYFTADLKKGQIALTFDDGPHPKVSEKILDILNRQKIKVSYFGVGKNVLKYPEIVKQAHKEGHSFGSHSYDHSNLPKISFHKATKNIAAGHNAVADTLGLEVPFFRFPYGNRSKRLQAWVKKSELATFFWNIDSLDWKLRNPKDLYRHTVKLINSAQRGILLFHDIHKQTETISK